MPLLTNYNVISLQCQKTGFTECYIALWIWKIVPFILVVVGIIGNVVSLIVLSSRQLRKKSTCVYLMFLAVTDTTLLCSGPLLHFLRNVFGNNIWTISTFSCSITGWIGFSSGVISCWIILLITAERTLLTLFPIKAKPKMTPRNALKVTVAVSMFAIFLNGHLIYGSAIVERRVNITDTNETTIHVQTMKSCSIRQGKYLDFYNGVWNKLIFVIGSLVPIILIVIGNAIVAISLIKSKRALRRVQQSDGRDVGRMIQLSPRSKANYKLFFVLCSVYITTTVPFGVYINIFPFNKEVDEHTLAKYQLTAVIMRCLLWSNFSFNFLLYFLTGSLFRKEMCRLFESAHKFFTSVTDRTNVLPLNDRTF